MLNSSSSDMGNGSLVVFCTCLILQSRVKEAVNAYTKTVHLWGVHMWCEHVVVLEGHFTVLLGGSWLCEHM